MRGAMGKAGRESGSPDAEFDALLREGTAVDPHLSAGSPVLTAAAVLNIVALLYPFVSICGLDPVGDMAVVVGAGVVGAAILFYGMQRKAETKFRKLLLSRQGQKKRRADTDPTVVEVSGKEAVYGAAAEFSFQFHLITMLLSFFILRMYVEPSINWGIVCGGVSLLMLFISQ